METIIFIIWLLSGAIWLILSFLLGTVRIFWMPKSRWAVSRTPGTLIICCGRLWLRLMTMPALIRKWRAESRREHRDMELSRKWRISR